VIGLFQERLFMWKRRREAARLQLIEITETLAGALRSGRSLPAALAQLPPRLCGRFRNELLALQRSSARSPGGGIACDEFAALVVAMEASRQSHIELAPVLLSLSRAMRARSTRWQPGAPR
jgi:Flp pilus assembly protein TadB